ncbi:TPA: branched-chain amino acid ABC transporter permease [bacterium]|nr:branched-chain amino acid ABC transporter permease [bacterium]
MKRFDYKWFYGTLILSGLILWILNRYNLAKAYYIQIYLLISINIILTTSLNVINGLCGQFSIGHAGFMAIGAYSSALFTTVLPKVCPSLSPLLLNPLSKILFFLFALIIGGFVAGFVGYLIGKSVLRLKGDYLAIVTLAFGEVVRTSIRLTDELAGFLDGIGWRVLGGIVLALGGPRGLGGIPNLTNIFWACGFTIMIVALITRLIHSSYGRAWVAIREDEIAASVMGIDTTRFKILAFSLSSLLAGLGGGLYAHLLMFIHPDSFSFIKSIEYLVYLYLGGMGSIMGSIISATTLTFLLEFLRIIQLQQWRLVIYPLILIIFMLTRPGGLFRKDL